MSAWADDRAVRKLKQGATAPNIRLGKVFGIDVGLNWSVVFVVALLAWSLARFELPALVSGQSETACWTAGSAGAVLFVLSLVAHEFAHSLVALRLGLRVRGITMWFFGGISEVGGIAKGPLVEAAVAAVGPATNLVIAAICVGLEFATIRLQLPLLVPAVLFWLAIYNAIIGGFNLIPGFPLDGGLVLEAIVWWRTGNRLAGVRAATVIGRLLAYAMVLAAFVELVRGDLLTGVWIAFSSWFQLVAIGSTESDITSQTLLQGIPVRDVMSSPAVTLSGSLTVDEFLTSVAARHHFTTYPLHDSAGGLTGMVRLVDLIHLPITERRERTLAECETALRDVTQTEPTEPITDLLERLGSSPEQRALVFDAGELVGVVSPTDVTRLLMVRRATQESREATKQRELVKSI